MDGFADAAGDDADDHGHDNQFHAFASAPIETPSGRPTGGHKGGGGGGESDGGGCGRG